MTINELWLTNFRNHHKLHVKFEDGITGIIGDNGKGKSSIIEAILFLLTGELFDNAKKEDAIKRGYDTGMVVGTFTLNGKKGRLERHLDMSKTVLDYDGKKLKLAKEVKELWDKLLQINPDIVKRVLIAQQGHLALLFSGDASVREKVFQKIFMVPPCDKIRKVIWDGYIKQAPPLIPEEDAFALSNSKDNLTFEIAKIKKSIDKLNIFTEAELADKRNRITFLRKCLDDRGKHGVLVVEYNSSKENKDMLQAKLDEISATLKLVNIVAYRSHRASLIQTKAIFDQKIKLDDEIKDIVYPFDKEQLTSYESKVDELTSRMHDYSSKSSVSANTVETLTTELSHISELVGHPKCPTCGHTLDDIASYAASLQERLTKATEERDLHKSAALKLKEEYLPIQTLIEEYYKLQQQEELLNKQLEPLKSLTFDADALTETEQVIEHYAHWENEFNRVQLLLVSAEGHFRVLETEIKQLAKYDKEGKPEDELIILVAEIDRHMNDVRVYQNENVSLRLKEAELTGVVKRIENNKCNREKNDKRNKYVASLTKAYDILESKNFPRKLVLNYADVVTEHLQENLQLFHIPYQARVVEGFKIEIIDEDDYVLPKASGGQAIQVGLSLHFALHDLFSQSFPLMVIDEGTSHQDGKNRAAYFNIIKNLKAKKKLKQIIIIDHDPALSEAVDHIIDLNEIEND